MRKVTVVFAAVTIAVVGCSDGIPWPGNVEAEVDHLTGARTGLFRTYGPTQLLTAGRDAIPVTVGYWCQVNQETEPVATLDGLFFKVAMPDTALMSNDEEAFEELSGKLGLLDVARMAVDGRVYAWQYEPTPVPGAWFLDGAMGFKPNREIDTRVERDEWIASLARLAFDGAEETVQELWPPAHDYVTSHYVGRDTLGIELKGVLAFSMEGFAAAADSVRFWCPVPQSNNEWNAARLEYINSLDSLRAIAVRQDSMSATFLLDRGVMVANSAAQRAIDAQLFVTFAREYGIYPLRIVDDVSSVCNIWDGLPRSTRLRFDRDRVLALSYSCLLDAEVGGSTALLPQVNFGVEWFPAHRSPP